MRNATKIEPSSLERIRCPCCGRRISVTLPDDYAPTYKYCADCGRKFILERLAEGFQVLPLEKCPAAVLRRPHNEILVDQRGWVALRSDEKRGETSLSKRSR
jgi:DNA-directed RNA polymerase subunit RPC12/RpoP